MLPVCRYATLHMRYLRHFSWFMIISLYARARSCYMLDRCFFIQKLAIFSFPGAFLFWVLQIATVDSVILISIHFCQFICVCWSCCCLIHVALSFCILQFSHILHQNSPTSWTLGGRFSHSLYSFLVSYLEILISYKNLFLFS